jgi:hypothetical protein
LLNFFVLMLGIWVVTLGTTLQIAVVPLKVIRTETPKDLVVVPCKGVVRVSAVGDGSWISFHGTFFCERRLAVAVTGLQTGEVLTSCSFEAGSTLALTCISIASAHVATFCFGVSDVG